MYYTMQFGHMRQPLWDSGVQTPTMLVASNYLTPGGRLRERPAPALCTPLAADCGGFYFAAKGKDFPFSYDEYTTWLKTFGPQLSWAACWDYPCEPEIAPNDAVVLQRQKRAVTHATALLGYAAPWSWVPVLQGRTTEQYVTHARMYRDAGAVRPYMGIGSLCRRTSINDISSIIDAVTKELPTTVFHLFGVKTQIFRKTDALPSSVASADTGAWNSMFFSGRERWRDAHRRGLTQDQYELWEALPRYRAKVEHAFSQPKQMTWSWV
jgi:hypothetical protein